MPVHQQQQPVQPVQPGQQPVQPVQQQQKKVQLQIQLPKHQIIDQSKAKPVIVPKAKLAAKPKSVQGKQSKPGQPAWEPASSNRPPRKAKTSSHYTPQSTPADPQQPKVPPQLAQGGRPSGRAGKPEQGDAEPSQPDPSEQQQLRGRATGWLRAALRGKSKK